MSYSGLHNERLHDAAAYLAAAEAVRRTPYHVAVVAEERRFHLRINDRLVRVFGRRHPDDQPLRPGSPPEVGDAHSLVFVDLTTDIPTFYVTPPAAIGEIGRWRDRWDRLEH